MSKQIFLTLCYDCGKRIAVETDKHVHGVYACNSCVPRDSAARNGIDEAMETDLFDEIENYIKKQ